MTTAATPAVPATPAAEPVAKPVPGTPEYDAAMTAVADAAMGVKPAAPVVETPAAEQRPAWLPEKFKSAEDLAKAYKELESKQGQPKGPPTVAPVLDTPAAQAAAQEAGFDWAALNAEFVEKGDLSPETRAKLAEKGLGQAQVDTYIEGQKAIAAKYDTEAATVAGGKDKLDSMLAWGGKNMTPGEAKAFNEATASGDVERMKLAISGLRSRFEASEGVTPKLVQGDASLSAGNVQGYASLQELSRDQANPLYKQDPAYRAKVEARVRATTAF